jgi:hypothetical protein
MVIFNVYEDNGYGHGRGLVDTYEVEEIDSVLETELDYYAELYSDMNSPSVDTGYFYLTVKSMDASNVSMLDNGVESILNEIIDTYKCGDTVESITKEEFIELLDSIIEQDNATDVHFYFGKILGFIEGAGNVRADIKNEKLASLVYAMGEIF